MAMVIVASCYFFLKLNACDKSHLRISDAMQNIGIIYYTALA